EECLAALRALFDGRSFPGGRLVPPLAGPVLPPPPDGGPAIWIGAQADPVVRMAGRLADGWNGWGLGPEAFRSKVEILEEAADERIVTPSWSGIVLAGSDATETEELIRKRRERGMDGADWTGTTDELTSLLAELGRAGAEWAVMVLAGPADRRSLLAERVLPALRRSIE
ncbi:MAG: LLM class flavin-dependent oxidoreductase, partial [Actinomycetota bacterium]|nr:LLM class flavin-dependent oxidoreductase [Actinomycetota bacterium]